MDPETHLFLNRLSLIISVVSAAFMTPEILGEHRMKAISSSILAFFLRVSWLILLLGVPAILFSLDGIDIPVVFWPILDMLEAIPENMAPYICGIPFFALFIYGAAYCIHLWEDADNIVNRVFYSQQGRRRLLIIGGVLLLISSSIQYTVTFP
ncbi:MAG: hypothetical protein IPM31_18300 [Anaerolineae bacterium]|nr:hypothetical protein [Anaerolineae bacterium]MBL8106067.1 hypothetical protein [Anaerolineales bacterium]MCC7190683.1 hypothetical protein [Anaerolineales bacterium]